jgi:plasmid stabilization system protein ParE
MADPLFRVDLTASLLERQEAIEAFLAEADAAFAFDRLLAELRSAAIPNLRSYPRVGRSYLDQQPQSTEALAKLAALRPGAADALREYLHGDYLIPYTLDATGKVVHLLSVRHHRELSFQFARLWPGA